FQLVTLPVEFNASSRALAILKNANMPEEDIHASKKVLTAAALTYVAALATSLANLLRLIVIVNGRNRD
ncbi:MAG: zinc metallopeptidase, partial [Clostridia bacterium]|nr:zinc metallopeptidase [Clostridia bacterium]